MPYGACCTAPRHPAARLTDCDCALVAGLCLLGYNPYVINTLEYGSIVYPLGGASADIDIMTGNTPAMYVGCNRFGNFFKSLLSVGDTSWALLNGGVTPGSLARAYSSDMRVMASGFSWCRCWRWAWR